MPAKNTIKVLIGGKIITLSGYESEEYLQSVASYMNHKLAQLSELPGYNRQPVETKNTLLSLNMSRGYVMFLAVVSAAALFMCVRYLQMKSAITTQTKEIATAESELSQLKADNDALYNSVISSVDLEKIKDKAMNELGMTYPQEDQIYQFDTAGNSYVRQYKDVPDTTK